MHPEKLLEQIKRAVLEVEPDAEIILYGSRSRGDAGLDIPVAAGLLANAARGLEVENPLPGLSWPGGAATASELADWFWAHTKAGETLRALKKVALQSEDPEMQLLGSLLLVPRAQAHRCEDETHECK